MRFRRIAAFILLITFALISFSTTFDDSNQVYASSVYDFTTSESLAINNVPGTDTLNIDPLIIDNNGPALSIDSISAVAKGSWSIIDYSTTDWCNLSADYKAFGLMSGTVDMSKTSLIDQGTLDTGESRSVNFDGHIGPRRIAVNDEIIANIITSVSITEEPVSRTTYLYQDGTMVINEQASNHDSNIANYGSVIATYPTYIEGETEWNSAVNIPWHDESVRSTIKNIFFDTPTKVSDMSYWFYNCSNASNIQLSNIDTSECTAMNHTFDGVSSIEYIDLCGLDTSSVTSLDGIFANCSNLKGIYVDDAWSTAAVTSGTGVVAGSGSLLGGDGHTYTDTDDYTCLQYDGYDTPGCLTYNGSDKCIITYDYNKEGYDFDSTFFNQVKSGANFSVGGAGKQVHNPNSGSDFRIRGFATYKYSKTYAKYTTSYASTGSSMIMYAIFYLR